MNRRSRDPSDENTLRNLEIALGYTDPSCVQGDKAFEPNNSLDGAVSIAFAAVEDEGRSLVSNLFQPNRQCPRRAHGTRNAVLSK